MSDRTGRHSVARACENLVAALGSLRQGRQAIEEFTFVRLERSHQTLSEASQATETAATALLNGLDRSLALVDRLEKASEPDRPGTLAELRNGLNMLFAHLQFQDITAQQLAGVAALLQDIERQVAGVVAELRGHPGPELGQLKDLPFNPDASFRDVADRQAGIDRVMAAARQSGFGP